MLELYQYITGSALNLIRFLCIISLTSFLFTALIFGGISYLIEKFFQCYSAHHIAKLKAMVETYDDLDDEDKDYLNKDN